MKTALIGALTAGILLAGCGSAASTPAPVESSSSGGEVAAAIPYCPEGPPARGDFKSFKDTYRANDGVVGTIHNTGDFDLGITRGLHDSPDCYLAPGKSVVFAGWQWMRFKIRERGWYEYDGPGKYKYQGNGTYFELSDPDYSLPTVTLGGEESYCPRQVQEKALAEDEWYYGAIDVHRLPDDAAAAREWSGVDSPKVDDWARIDVRVLRVGTGC